MKIFNVLATALSFGLAGATITAGLNLTAFLWIVCGLANLFICMYW
jgi:hypothetical protein